MEEVSIDTKGLVGDRRFMLVVPRPPPLSGSFEPNDATYQFVSQRQCRLLATIDATWDKTNKSLTLSSSKFKGKQTSWVIYPYRNALWGKTYKARIWDDNTEVIDLGDEAATFIQQIATQDKDAPEYANKIRLVLMKKDDRIADDKYTPSSALSWTGRTPSVALTDGFPILIASQASLDELNKRLTKKGKEAIPMSRFRPNIVITGTKPFEEDTWKIIAIGNVIFHLVKGCPRCKQSCTDQITGQVSDEPVATLSEFRALGPIKENVYFAQNAIPHQAGGGSINVGAPIQVLQRGEPVWDT